MMNIIKKLFKYLLKDCVVCAMFNLAVFEILLFDIAVTININTATFTEQQG